MPSGPPQVLRPYMVSFLMVSSPAGPVQYAQTIYGLKIIKKFHDIVP
jgi:hypothetical protein